jgi:hypothetical protein
VPFRVFAANQKPDHDTTPEFRRRSQPFALGSRHLGVALAAAQLSRSRR